MRKVHAAIASSVVVLALVGCNTILDNQPGLLTESGEAGVQPAPSTQPTAPGDRDGSADVSATTEDAGTEAVDAGPPPCPAGQQRCSGACVSPSDPLHGCGDPSCAPCPSAHASMACDGGKCVVASCNPGYADCNAKASDGCESNLSKPATCGSCNGACGALAPLCAPSGATFQCSNGCPASSPAKCGAECVDPMTSLSHCGACNSACPDVANAVSACTLGVCGVTCRATFHMCAGKCAADTDPTACGAACAVCPVPAGGTAACVDGACQGACPAGAHLCAGKCVADSDATACGAACAVCPVPPGGAASCVAGACRSTCTAGTHLCAGKCVADSDATACGAACAVCPAPANATAACTGGACAFSCTAGFGNCDANAANGCEALLASDPLNCGTCGVTCALGQLCIAGVCL
jgi:hypothetical protein